MASHRNRLPRQPNRRFLYPLKVTAPFERCLGHIVSAREMQGEAIRPEFAPPISIRPAVRAALRAISDSDARSCGQITPSFPGLHSILTSGGFGSVVTMATLASEGALAELTSCGLGLERSSASANGGGTFNGLFFSDVSARGGVAEGWSMIVSADGATRAGT